MRRAIPILAVLALARLGVLTAPLARADELKLKDGSKIVGTIVGFEESSFKVKTNYGYAVVQKDQVASITISEPAAKAAASEKKSEPAAEKKFEPAKPAKTEIAKAPPPASVTPPASPTTPAAVAPTTRSAPANTPAASAPPPAPLKPAAPEPIREEVSGNTYTNQTYGFRMYKPPDWQVIEGAQALLPGAIAAMGTSDQTTYLLIGQESAGKSLANDIDATEKRLREIMDNFRPLGEKRVTVSGVSAIEHRFRGSVDEHDWSGVVVYLPRDTHLYTIFGMTYADSDLVQIQENVIHRAISSLQFTK